MGSFAPRVRYFLAAVAPDIDQANSQSQVAVADRPPPVVNMPYADQPDELSSTYPSSPWTPSKAAGSIETSNQSRADGAQLVSTASANQSAETQPLNWSDLNRAEWYEPLKSVLAAIGLAAIVLRIVRMIR
jgi:hypothetical protein